MATTFRPSGVTNMPLFCALMPWSPPNCRVATRDGQREDGRLITRHGGGCSRTRRRGGGHGRDEPEAPVAPQTGIPHGIGCRRGHARKRGLRGGSGEPGAGSDAADGRPSSVQRPLRGRDPEPGRLPARRDGCGDALPRRDGCSLPRLPAPPAQHLQRALRVRGGEPRERPEPGARPRGPGTGLEEVRAQGLGQRLRGRDVGPSAVRPRALPGPLPVRDRLARRRRRSPEGGDHRLESVRGWRSRQLEPAVRSPRVSAHEPHRAWADRRLLVERSQLHGGGEGREGGARNSRRLRPVGRRDEGEAVGRRLLLREDGRGRGPGEPRLVPGRVVRRPDPRLEGRRGGRLLRPSGRHRGQARARGHPLRAVRSRARRVEDDRGPALVVRGVEPPAVGRRPRGRRAGRRSPLPPVVRAALLGNRRGGRGLGGRATPSCGRRRPASRTASTTRPSRPRSSRRWPPTSRS